ncbi:MAG: hypothetical protein CMJ37_00255, partial [Phycisphaerae bacterium]|nr:hypothetical protein [Phycisphaerae bacterium]
IPFEAQSTPTLSGDSKGSGTWGDDLTALYKMNAVLGVLDLGCEPDRAAGGMDEAVIEEKLVARAEAKASRDFAAADAIRDQLIAAGIVIKDGPDGTTWTRSVG